MIGRLNLNHRELTKDREDVFDRIDEEDLDFSDFFDSASGIAQSYAHVVCRRFCATIP